MIDTEQTFCALSVHILPILTLRLLIWLIGWILNLLLPYWLLDWLPLCLHREKSAYLLTRMFMWLLDSFSLLPLSLGTPIDLHICPVYLLSCYCSFNSTCFSLFSSLSVFLLACLFVYLPACLSISLPVCFCQLHGFCLHSSTACLHAFLYLPVRMIASP